MTKRKYGSTDMIPLLCPFDRVLIVLCSCFVFISENGGDDEEEDEDEDTFFDTQQPSPSARDDSGYDSPEEVTIVGGSAIVCVG